MIGLVIRGADNIHEVNVIAAKSGKCPRLMQAELAVDCAEEVAEMGKPNVSGSGNWVGLFKY